MDKKPSNPRPNASKKEHTSADAEFGWLHGLPRSEPDRNAYRAFAISNSYVPAGRELNAEADRLSPFKKANG